jgi:hypothetical protein
MLWIENSGQTYFLPQEIACLGWKGRRGGFRHSGRGASKAYRLPRCDGISTLRRSFRGARGQQNDIGN